MEMNDQVREELQNLDREVELHSDLCQLTEGCFRKCLAPATPATIGSSDMLSDAQAMCMYHCFFRTMNVFNTVSQTVMDIAQAENL